MGRLAAVPYYGGKHRLAKHIMPIIAGIEHKCYVEPFCGGASVFFQLPTIPPTTVLNDMNRCMVLLYQVLKVRSVEFLAVLDGIPFSRYAYQQAKFHLADCDVATSDPAMQLQIAVDTYVSLCMSFGNVLGDDGGWRVDQSRGSDPQTWENRKQHLAAMVERVSQSYIDCSDYASCIRRWDSVNTLFYIDPPYVGTDLGHYGSTAKAYTVAPFSAADLQGLCDQLDGIKGRFILSGYATGIQPRTAVDLCVSAGSKKIGTKGYRTDAEWLWIN